MWFLVVNSSNVVMLVVRLMILVDVDVCRKLYLNMCMNMIIRKLLVFGLNMLL